MAICTYEVMEFGPPYADDVIQNAKALAEVEMERIAELIKAVIIDQKDVREEVHRFRSDHQNLRYNYDGSTSEQESELINIA